MAFVQFDLGFAPGVVKADPAGASPSPALPIDWFFASPGTVDNVIGQILGVDAFGSPVNGTSAVANIQFKALAPGVSPLTLSNVFLNLSEQGFTVLDGQITVVVPTVPLTPGLPLLISALLLAATWLLYRRRSLN